MATKKAPARGVIRHESGAARRISAGDPIPDGWTFDGGAAPKTQDAAPTKKAKPKPAETTEAAGPSETA